MEFVDSQRARGFALESILYALEIAGLKVGARTYREWRNRSRRVADRTITDALIMDALEATRNTPESLYGRRKMVQYLRKKGLQVAFCTVHRLMKDLGMAGAVRGKKKRTTIQSKDAMRAGDLLNRDFTSRAPNTILLTCQHVLGSSTSHSWSISTLDQLGPGTRKHP